MNRLNDLDINCAARRVLVRHWVDLGKASLRTINGVLTVHGALEKLPHAGSPLTASVVCEISSELKRIPSVRRVTLDFINWTENAGKWCHVSTKSTAKRPKDGFEAELNRKEKSVSESMSTIGG